MTPTIDPATLQAGVEKIVDELTAALRAKGCDEVRVKIEFHAMSTFRPFEIWLHNLPMETGETCAYAKADTLGEAVEQAQQLIAELRYVSWSHEDIGRTLGVIEEPQP